MLAAELAAHSTLVMGGRVSGIREVDIAGVSYIAFDGRGLTEQDIAIFGTLSSVYALYRVVERDGEHRTDERSSAASEEHAPLLEPVVLPRPDRYDDDLISILKYPGKTNEQFTRMLVNLTAAALGDAGRILEPAPDRRLRVLDPMCGRGTTLNQVLRYGWDAYGVDLDKRDFEAYSAFIIRWLKSKRIKHQADTSRVRISGETLGRRLAIELAPSKAQYKSGQTQRLDVVNADTLRTSEVFGPSSVDLIVTDAPYGVQHGATSGGSLARDPGELIRQALPGWRQVLRTSGAIGISWNTRVLDREGLAEILDDGGFDVLTLTGENGEELDFTHRVDQSITRDLIIARPSRAQV